MLENEIEVDVAITRTSQKGITLENNFAGVVSFLRRVYTKDLTGVELAVTGVPFDMAASNRPGTRFGPRAIRAASTLQPYDTPYGWDIDPLSDHNVIDYGDVAFDFGQISLFPGVLEDHIAGIINAGPGTLALGGDHYITFPILRAYAKKFGPMSMIQFDAHSDTWVDDDPNRIDHGTMFYKAVKEGLIDPKTSVQVGIRTSNADTLGVNIIDAPEVHRIGPAAVIDKIKGIVGGNKTYVTFDIDCLDPAYAPGTGTPVWGGLTSAQAAEILRGLAGINMVGGDIVEVSPSYDASEATAIAGAHVATELMCLYFAGARGA
ncbi:agmatinase [Rhodobacterales bacterium HTCC2150]|nr:agmatinase [Rhodobacterales bacterium HTCC2150] [Rhodobacteraceae bacterium HTCC2150]